MLLCTPLEKGNCLLSKKEKKKIPLILILFSPTGWPLSLSYMRWLTDLVSGRDVEHGRSFDGS